RPAGPPPSQPALPGHAGRVDALDPVGLQVARLDLGGSLPWGEDEVYGQGDVAAKREGKPVALDVRREAQLPRKSRDGHRPLGAERLLAAETGLGVHEATHTRIALRPGVKIP